MTSFSLTSTLVQKLPRKTCQGKTCQEELVCTSVYSQQVFHDKGTCQGKLASVNEALALHQRESDERLRLKSSFAWF